jgi:hypothetical protein
MKQFQFHFDDDDGEGDIDRAFEEIILANGLAEEPQSSSSDSVDDVAVWARYVFLDVSKVMQIITEHAPEGLCDGEIWLGAAKIVVDMAMVVASEHLAEHE